MRKTKILILTICLIVVLSVGIVIAKYVKTVEVGNITINIPLTSKTITVADLIATASDDTDDGLWASSLTNDGYRYVGTDPDNYICFGTDDVDECLANTDQYMYRIIGIFADSSGEYHLKLIKKSVLDTEYTWHSDGYDIDWENSSLYNGLNGSYFLTSSDYFYMQDSTWNNLIADWTWIAANTLTYENYGNTGIYGINYVYNTVETVYYHESNQTSLITDTCYYSSNTAASCAVGDWTTTTAKIGLMYVSDYLLSLGNNSLSLKASSNRATLRTGWLSSADGEWTMSSFGLDMTVATAWLLNPMGDFEGYWTPNEWAVRPVFYLESDVELASGDGSSSNPYMIQTGASDDEEGYYVYFTGDVDKIVFSYNGLENTEITEYGLYSVSLSSDASISLNSNSGCTYFTLSVIDTVDQETVDSFSTLTSLNSSYDINSSIDVTAGDNYEIYVTAYGCLSLFS